MKPRLTAAAAALLLTGTALATPGPAQAAARPGAGDRSLATVLAADGHHFDKNPHDFDVLDKLVTRVLTRKPDSRLAILTDGSRRLTAFLPTDGAMRRTISDINDRHYGSERQVFRGIWSTAGLRGTERVLLYHLVRGATLTYAQARKAAPTSLRTMQGGSVDVRKRHGRLLLHDHNPASPNARVIPALRDINAGNRQIAHGISWVISPD
ncbi:fasciclin domain-containing protein [Nocardioides panaciterrulae]|uniref:Putative surface protein with fasciclin (FAS1) repeats n=1 Tax=Nocardioides panaciterrulae TaxID=661492 RepID=A0A7Y9EAL0_9ACTN|nr:fasciclin domain-containing protein [Nocardioides panaciterrulae]NYD43895.1 putative surface protein with fasciclin (FAS1) repeats [Nocardioides panaciterrulae]